jgi:NADPH:quinone reductase-like Zn-dependent oxidoreductase
MMKAIAQDGYGPLDAVLELKDVEKPVVGNDDVLVRVHAASVNQQDCHVVTGIPYVMRVTGYGLRRPTISIRGTDVAGTVEAVGEAVTAFQPGDEVFGWCDGAFAEYGCAPQGNFVAMPADLTFEQAACIGVAAFTALRGVRDVGQVHEGQKVLINGAAGGVGTFAVQIAKALGAEVTGVCSSKSAEMVRSIGADRVVDYTTDDFTMGEERYDVMLDIVANHSLSACRGVLTTKGRYVLISNSGGRWLGPLARFAAASLTSLLVSQTMRAFVSVSNREDLIHLRVLAAAGQITPGIDNTNPRSDGAEAMAHVSEGHAQGKTVITVEGGAAA